MDRLETIFEDDVLDDETCSIVSTRASMSLEFCDVNAGTHHRLVFKVPASGIDLEGMRYPMVVRSVAAGGYAAEEGVQVGWVLSKVNDVSIVDMDARGVLAEIKKARAVFGGHRRRSSSKVKTSSWNSPQ